MTVTVIKYIKAMKRKRLLAQLEDLAGKLGIEIRRESLGQSCGGLCRIGENLYIFLNKGVSDSFGIELLASALSKFDTSKMYLLPEVRGALDRRKRATNEK